MKERGVYLDHPEAKKKTEEGFKGGWGKGGKG